MKKGLIGAALVFAAMLALMPLLSASADTFQVVEIVGNGSVNPMVGTLNQQGNTWFWLYADSGWIVGEVFLNGQSVSWTDNLAGIFYNAHHSADTDVKEIKVVFIRDPSIPLPPAATPVAAPPGGSYPVFPQPVTLSCATASATIHYTLDGSTPTTNSAVYGGSISVNAGQTLKAIATAPGFSDSAVMSATYTQGSSWPSGTDTGYTEPETQSMPVYEQAKIGRCKEWVNIRSGPSTKHDIIGRAYLGETIELVEWNQGETWCKVYYDNGNKVGWVFGKFIVLQK